MLALLQAEKPDVILVPGDIVGHSISRSQWQKDSKFDYVYENVMDVLEYVAKEISAAFPESVILPAIGNNDCEYHY